MKALLLIDIQNGYFPDGGAELCAGEVARQKACSLLRRFREEGLPVFHVRHAAARSQAGFFRPGAKGSGIYACVAPKGGEPIIIKHYLDSFRNTPLLPLLRAKKVTELVIAGMMTRVCVNATVRTAEALGFACVVAQDLLAARDASFASGGGARRAVERLRQAAGC